VQKTDELNFIKLSDFVSQWHIIQACDSCPTPHYTR